MISRRGVEIMVGVFVLAGVAALVHLSIGLARREAVRGKGYHVKAVFSDVGGLRSGAAVSVAGVDVGSVSRIALKEYQGEVSLFIDARVKLQVDSIASIRTRGLMARSSSPSVRGATNRCWRKAVRSLRLSPPSIWSS